MRLYHAALAVAVALAACGSGDEADCDPIAATLVERIEVSPASAMVTPGQATTLTAQAFSCAGPISPVAFTWESANPAVATVTAAGVVTGVATGGPVQVIARAQGKQAAASVTVGLVPVVAVTVTPGTTTVGVGRTAQLTAHAFDGSGHELADRGATWSSANDAVARVSASGVVTGVAAGGPVAITATIEGVAGTSQVTVSLVPVASVTVAPTTATIAAGESVQLTATTRDDQGNVLPGRAVAWSSSDPDVAAVSETGLVTGRLAGGPVTITATSEGQAGTATVTVTVGAPSRLAYVQQPTDVQAGSAIAPAIVVEVQDAGGNRVRGDSSVVVLGIELNPGGATLGGTLSVRAVDGRARFTNIWLNRTGAGYTMLASAAGLTSVTSTPFTVTPGAADHLVIVTQPASTRVGEAITPAVQVEVRDRFENLATDFNAAVVTVLADNPGGATLGGTTSVAAVAGVAQFADLTLDRPGIGYTLRIGTAMQPAVVSSPFNVAPGVATGMRVIAAPSAPVTAGAPFTVAVEAVDVAGNVVTSHAGDVALALANGVPGAVLSGPLTGAFSGGVATFAGLSIDLTAVGYVVTATSPGLADASTPAFDVVPGPAQALRFVVEPSGIEEGDPFPGTVQVQVVDALGNRATSATNLVTIIVRSASGGSPPSGVTLGGDGTQNAVAGLAQYPGLTVNLSGILPSAQTLRLRASATGLGTMLSNTFVVTPD